MESISTNASGSKSASKKASTKAPEKVSVKTPPTKAPARSPTLKLAEKVPSAGVFVVVETQVLEVKTPVEPKALISEVSEESRELASTSTSLIKNVSLIALKFLQK